ncbi:unnamed protein product [Cylicostephanus goldi]|uniref:Uncharacterized protein n=1 Tax=Cylicostephanus goldi TaxID=71465 RepID=A0A3P6QMP4_CYLGO|nr:unnamed protein product [Cylicostephanus goldi]
MLNSIDDNMLNSQLLGDIKSEADKRATVGELLWTSSLLSAQCFLAFSLSSFAAVLLLERAIPMDYTIHNETPNVAHPQYIVTTQPDMMLPQGIGYQHHGLDQCVILTTGHDYVPNFDYPMIGNYQMQAEQHEAPPPSHDSNDEKIVPYEQW